MTPSTGRSPRSARRGAAIGGRRRLPARRGPQLTNRDVEILAWIGRHGVVTPAQVARHFFTREDGTIGQWAAYRRLRKLEDMGLTREDRTFWREPNVLRLTGPGARLTDIEVGPAKLVLGELRHTLALVDLIEWLLLNSPKGTEIRTEREMRAERRRELTRGARKPGRGRVPDAVFIAPRGGATVAIELDITPKRSRDLENILRAYIQERHDRIVWYVLPRQQDRLKEIVRKEKADDVVEVRAWHGSPFAGKA
jgi:hypothetical protein